MVVQGRRGTRDGQESWYVCMYSTVCVAHVGVTVIGIAHLSVIPV